MNSTSQTRGIIARNILLTVLLVFPSLGLSAALIIHRAALLHYSGITVGLLLALHFLSCITILIVVLALWEKLEKIPVLNRYL